MKYTPSHEWIKLENGTATIGVTEYAQRELGDIVYVEMPKINRKVNAGDAVCVLESTKAAADVYSPVAGVILEVNEQLKGHSDLINSSPEKEGWLFKMKLENPEDLNKLLDQNAYQALTGK